MFAADGGDLGEIEYSALTGAVLWALLLIGLYVAAVTFLGWLFGRMECQPSIQAAGGPAAAPHQPRGGGTSWKSS